MRGSGRHHSRRSCPAPGTGQWPYEGGEGGVTLVREEGRVLQREAKGGLLTREGVGVGEGVGL